MTEKKLKIDEKMVAQVEALSAFLSAEQIAGYLGICRKTFFNYMNEFTELRTAMDRGMAKAIGTVAQGLVQQAKEGNTTAAIFYLKTKGGWKEAQDVNLSGGIEIKIGNEFDKLLNK